jgi:glutaredoxin
VKEFLKEKNMECTEIDVSVDHAAATEMVKLSGQMGVPVIDVEGKIIVGWNKSALDDALAPRKRKLAMAT